MMDLTITGINGNSQRLTVDHNATVGELKQLISQHFNVNPSQQKLFANNGQRIILEDDSRRLCDYGVTSLSTLALLIMNPEPMQVFVKNVNGKICTYDVSVNETVDQLQRKIYNVARVPVDQQRLLFDSKQLESSKMLQDYNIRHGSTIDMLLRLRGGQ